MKTINEVINQTPVFLHNWTCKNDVIFDFDNVAMCNEEYISENCPWKNTEYYKAEKKKAEHSIQIHENDNILFASYGTDNWSGDAFVLFERDSILYEVNGYHCSCYGLEGQWEEEETSIEALSHRITKGELGKDDYSGNEFHDELCEFLGIET